MAKREVEIVIISDVHLGTYGCHAKELLNYLKSIRPKTLILNGDIIDIWQFSKSYWPEAHMKVLRRLMKFIADSGRVIYLNSGDWVESLTALEYDKKAWKIFKYDPVDFRDNDPDDKDQIDQEDLAISLNVKFLFESMKTEMP